ncbi:MAG: hypothetical protein ABL930_07820, partial [Pseudobdellovibrio sp.]
MKTAFSSLALVLILLNTAAANELRMSRNEATSKGFKPVKSQRSISAYEVPKNSLVWPVKFIDSKHTIGNSMPEYQNYSNEAYYHEGSDLRVSKAGEIKAPVDGFLQGGYYTYVTDPNTGEDKKFTKPISEGGDELYFEITIKTSEGFMFEFHHTNPKNLPKNILDIVLRGGGEILKGDVIGYASVWPISRFGERYDHIHYNLISPEGVYMNAEYFSQALSDSSAPVIKNIFAIYKDKKVEVIAKRLNGLPSELIVSAFDMKGENVYPLPPVIVEASWSDSFKTGWDFTQKLLTTSGLFPDIREVFARNLKLSDGRSFTTKGDYSNTEFLFRLKLPANVQNPITLTVKDISGNVNKVLLEL